MKERAASEREIGREGDRFVVARGFDDTIWLDLETGDFYVQVDAASAEVVSPRSEGASTQLIERDAGGSSPGTVLSQPRAKQFPLSALPIEVFTWGSSLRRRLAIWTASRLLQMPKAFSLAHGSQLRASLALLAATLMTRLLRLDDLFEVLLTLRNQCAPKASQSEAYDARRAVLSSPIRPLLGVACYEESVATYILCALRGRRIAWCLGARTPPFESHAWIESDGQPVDEAPDEIQSMSVMLCVPC